MYIHNIYTYLSTSTYRDLARLIIIFCSSSFFFIFFFFCIYNTFNADARERVHRELGLARARHGGAGNRGAAWEARQSPAPPATERAARSPAVPGPTGRRQRPRQRQ